MRYSLLTHPYFFIPLYQTRTLPCLYVPIFCPVFNNNPGDKFYFNPTVETSSLNNFNLASGRNFPKMDSFSVKFGSCTSNQCNILVKYDNSTVAQFDIDPNKKTVWEKKFNLRPQLIEGSFKATLQATISGSNLCVNVCILQFNKSVNEWVPIATNNCINKCTNV